MPYITVESGQLTPEQKEQLIRRLTETAAEIMNVPPEFFLITVRELPDENIGIGGKTIDRIKKAYREERKEK